MLETNDAEYIHRVFVTGQVMALAFVPNGANVARHLFGGVQLPGVSNTDDDDDEADGDDSVFWDDDDEYGGDDDEQYADLGRGEPVCGSYKLQADDLRSITELAELNVAELRAKNAQSQLGPGMSLESMAAEKAKVNGLLMRAGYSEEEVNGLSCCARLGLARGAFGFEFTGAKSELDRPFVIGCNTCDKKLRCTIADLLCQPDSSGCDYEDGGMEAILQCKKCGGGTYVSDLCNGKPESDSGKFTNHCSEENCLGGLGVCIYDYRNRHCDFCWGHYFNGLMGAFACPCTPLRRAILRAKKGDRAAIAALVHRFLVNRDDEDDESEEIE